MRCLGPGVGVPNALRGVATGLAVLALLAGCGTTQDGGAPASLPSAPTATANPVAAPGTAYGAAVGVTGTSRMGSTPPSGLGFTRANPGWVTTYSGPISGVRARILVWLPPEYGRPADAHRVFPVVQLVGGFPAALTEWVHRADVVGAFAKARAAGMPPAVLVATEVNVEGRNDLECLNAPGHAKVETWITRDVPTFMRAHFRVAPAGDWGIMGYSMGGFCAPYLALSHPDIYRAAVAINGYLVPTTPRLDPHFLARHSLLLAAGTHPSVSILWTTTRSDWNSPVSLGLELQRALAPATPVTVRQVSGVGHWTRSWSPFVWQDLLWLVPRLPTS